MSADPVHPAIPALGGWIFKLFTAVGWITQMLEEQQDCD
jgi:hypothetical protein